MPRCLAYQARRASGFSDLKKIPPMPRTRFMGRIVHDHFNWSNKDELVASIADSSLRIKENAAVCKARWPRRSRLQVPGKQVFRAGRQGGAPASLARRRELPGW